MSLEVDNLLADEQFFQDPHTIFHQLRGEAPVCWSDNWNAWILTRYDDVMSVMRQTDVFSSAGRISYLLDSLPDDLRETLTRLERHYEIGVAHSDPPDHTRLRSLINKVFTPRMVETWKPKIEQVTDELIAAMLDKEQPDIIADVAYPLPATIIAQMIGAPPEDIHLFRDWAVDINRLFELGGRMNGEAAKNAQNSLFSMREYILKLVELRRKHPQDDIISRFVSAEEKLSIDELVSTCVTLFVAGHETTTNLISNGIYLLLTHPEQMWILQQNPEKIDNAIEEILRFEPSVPRAWRLAKNDVTIGDKLIKAGSLIFPMLSAANRDPQHFSQPDKFLIEREHNKHLAFGYGIHFCLGAPLARVEAAIAIQKLIHIPRLELKRQASWCHDVAIRRLDSLSIDANRMPGG